MKKSQALKKDPTANTNAGRNNTDKSDPRPLRDQAFMKAAKQKLFRFFEITDYPHRFDNSMFLKTQIDVKANFEHMINVAYPGYRLNDSKIAAEDQILNFFTAIQYNNNFSKTHITSPSIYSSVPFVIGAFDYLRRFISAFIRTDPKMLFPRITTHRISSEIVFDALIPIYRKVRNEEFEANSLIDLQDAIRNEIGIKSSNEITKISQKVDQIEHIFNNVQRIAFELEEQTKEFDKIIDCIDTNDRKFAKSKEMLYKIQAEKRDETKNLEAISKEIAKSTAKKTEYEEMGYENTINQIEDYHEKITKKRMQTQQLKSEIDELKQTPRSTELEVEDIRFQSQKIFADVLNIFPDMVDDDMCRNVTELQLDCLLNYDTYLRPYISNLISSIANSAQIKRDELKEHIKQREDLTRNSEVLKSDIKLFELENQQSIKNLNQNEAICQTLQQESEEYCKTIQDFLDQVTKQRIINENIDRELADSKRRFEEEKAIQEEANLFYDIDIDFKKECADIRLQSLQDGYELRQTIIKENMDFIDDIKENINSFEVEQNKYKVDLLKRMTEELSKVDENYDL